MGKTDLEQNDPRTIRILAISGSIRARSTNAALLHAMAKLAPDDVKIAIYGGLVDLPHFNPDLDGDTVPGPVATFRQLLQTADGVLISSPEYAHGVPGVLKNALDWVVSSVEFVGKPVALINASPRSTYAQASLAETLTVMSASLIAEASVTVPLLGRTLPEGGIIADAEIAGPLRSAISAFATAIDSRRTSTR